MRKLSKPEHAPWPVLEKGNCLVQAAAEPLS